MTSNRRTWRALGLLACLVVAAYANSLKNGFAFDDAVMIEQNQLIQRLDYLPKLVSSDYWAGRLSPTEAASWTSGLYRPLVLISYAANYAVGGLHPFGYHLVNLGLHLLVTWLVYLLALRAGLASEAALAAGALFGVHPLHTEAVSWIVGRAELLMAAGVLGALLAHASGRPLLALPSFAVGLFSKEQAMVLPVLVLLYDVCKGTVPFPGTGTGFAGAGPVKTYAGYLLVLAVYLAVRAKVLGQLHSVPVLFIDNPLAGLDDYRRLLNVMKVAGYYLWLCIWPAGLSADYSYNAIALATSIRDAQVLAALLGWGALLGLAAWSFFRGNRRACFAVGLTAISFLPASNLLIPIGTIMAERLFYVPSAGLCLLAALAYEQLNAAVRRSTFDVEPRASNLERCSRVTRYASRVIVIASCLALTLRTIQRNMDWAGTERLMLSAVQVVPASAKVHAVLGEIALARNELAQALEHLRRAMALYPDYIHTAVTININLGSALLKTGETGQAIEAYERAVQLDPGASATHFNLALAYTQQGLYAVAERIMRQALALNPASPEAHGALGAILLQLGRYEEALSEAEAALRLRPDLEAAAADRAAALHALGRTNEAEAAATVGSGALIPGMVGRRARESGP